MQNKDVKSCLKKKLKIETENQFIKTEVIVTPIYQHSVTIEKKLEFSLINSKKKVN